MSKLLDIALHAVLGRVRRGTTTPDDARWLRLYIGGQSAQIDGLEKQVRRDGRGEVAVREEGEDGT